MTSRERKAQYRRAYAEAMRAAIAGDVLAFDAAIVQLCDSFLDRLRYRCARKGIRWPR